MVDCLKMFCTPFYPMVLLIIIPSINGYFIGKINPTFPDKPGGLSRFLNGTIIFLRPQYCWIDPPSPTAMETRFISTCITIIFIYIYMYIYMYKSRYTIHYTTPHRVALHCTAFLHYIHSIKINTTHIYIYNIIMFIYKHVHIVYTIYIYNHIYRQAQ